MMRTFLLALASATLLALPASAADLTQPASADMDYAKAFSWTGAYGGLSVGYAQENDNWDNIWGGYACGANLSALCSSGPLGRLNPKGGIAGVTAGYNMQFNSIVLGVEGEWGFTNLSDQSENISNTGYGTATLATKTPWIGSLAGRFGLAAGRTLFYGKGGVAAAEFDRDVGNFIGFSDPPYNTNKQTRVGFVVGGGIEQAVTDHITMKLEGDYYDFGSSRVGFHASSCNDCYNSDFATDTHVTAFVVKTGINLKY